MDNIAKPEKSIAVLIPCYNEEQTVAQVVKDFRKFLPEAVIYVFDNNSTDKTAENARAAGAEVVFELHKGKGNVVRAMFEKITADVYLMVDGDSTYPAEFAHALVQPILDEKADVVVGRRVAVRREKAYPLFHQFGNKLVCGLVNTLFKADFKDVMSGYRAFSRYFVDAIPLSSKGFEIETEMAIKSMVLDMVVREIDVDYIERPAGSESKLNTFRDGMRVINAIVTILRYARPLLLFGLLGIFSFSLGIISGAVVIVEFIKTRYITHVPLAILSVGFVMFGLVSGVTGLILDNIKNAFNELNSYVYRHSKKK